MGKPSLLGQVIRWFFRRPVTIHYPYQETSVEKDIRGRHYVDLRKCIGCSLCARECPAFAIKMEKAPEGVVLPRNKRGLIPVIYYAPCIFCYRCVTVCPTNAFITTQDYHLSGPSKTDSRELSLKTLEEGVAR